jgi:hypothetical protein
MKHWDLFPGETVTLKCGSRRLEARFLFRDTKIAAFRMESGEYREFKLRQSGTLREPEHGAEVLGYKSGTDHVTAADLREAISNSPVWVIEGEDRHTRHVVQVCAPLESRTAGGTP